MSRLTLRLILGVIFLLVACAESSEELFDSSVGTVFTKTVSVQEPPTRQPSVEHGPPATSIFCPGCQLVDVVGIVDGDTIDTSIGRVRFLGVDTPERGEACFAEATEFTRLLVGNQVRLEDGPRLEDNFGRRLAYVYDASGNSLDVQLIAAGFAKARTRDGQNRDLFVDLEADARSNSAGCLWSSVDKASMTDTKPQTGAFDPVEHLADFIISRELATTHVFGLTNKDGDEVYFASGRSGLPARRETSAWFVEELDHGAWIIYTDGEIWNVYDSRSSPIRLWP